MIKNFVFDLGNVLVKVDIERFIDNLEKEGFPNTKIKKLVTDKYLKNLLESGKIDFVGFYKRCKNYLNASITQKRFKEIFNDMFSTVPGMEKILQDIKKTHSNKIILLSNTNSVHFNYIRKKFEIINYIDKFALSYKLKTIKPDFKIYQLLIAKYHINPSETLFVDDLVENCISASQMGFKVILFEDYKSFLKKLKKYYYHRS